MAVISLVAGIGSWVVLPVIGSIVAVVTGHVARKQIRQSAGAQDGEGMALAGLILGYTHLALGCVGSIVAVVLILAGVISAAALVPW